MFFYSEDIIKRLSKKLISQFFILSFVVYLFGTACQNPKLIKENEVNLPKSIITSAEDYIKFKTGEEYFQKFIQFDSINSKKINSFYEVHFKLNDPKKEFINEVIKFYVTEIGAIDETKEIIGIPNCKDNPSEGIFNLDENGAVEAALSYGLEEGIKDWKVNFEWTNEFKRYTWHLLSTYKEFGGENNYKANGEEIFINPFDGSLITKREWSIR